MIQARALLARPRLEMDLRTAGLPFVPLLGRYNYSHARPALAEHSHGKALEICYLVRGRQTYRTQGRDYYLRGGDVFIAFPGEQHSTGGTPEGKGVLYWVVVQAPGPGARFMGLPARPGHALWRAIRDLGIHHFPGTGKMKEHLDAATLAFHGDAPLRRVAINHLLTGFFLELATCGFNPRPLERRSLEPVLKYMAANLGEPVSVPQLAGIARLSTPHFKARFKEEMGVPPAEYQLRARVEEARRRLAASKHTVTRIAFDLGFSSSQYFATVFKRFTGENPSRRVRLKPSI
jgi:AraC-like DNA-binding protein